MLSKSAGRPTDFRPISTYQRSCFCVPDWTRPVVIDVKDNRIGRIVYADDEVPVGPTYWKSYHTVDELFALIDSALVEMRLR